MLIDTSQLPTPVAQVARRLNTIGPDRSADTFLLASYLAEAVVKTIGIALHGGIRPGAQEVAYRYAHSLLRAEGLGQWEWAIREMTTHPTASYLPLDFRPLLVWATKRRSRGDETWFDQGIESVNHLRATLGLEIPQSKRGCTVRDLLSALVEIRNKTKAHGAWGPDFFAEANTPYITALQSLVTSCPLFQWPWMHLLARPDGTVRGVWLTGHNPQYMRDAEAAEFTPPGSGLHFMPRERVFWLGDLLRSDRECREFFFPNGAYSEGKAEFIDYLNGRSRREPVSEFVRPPVSLPASETAGSSRVDIQSNVFGNLPQLPKHYVKRASLEAEIEKRVCDHNHPIITLHGQGGIGKTTAALSVAHRLADSKKPRFEHIVWFSARDIDLRPSGPSQVRPAVQSLREISELYGALFWKEPSEETLAKTLESPAEAESKGILFIFDNFETFDDIVGIHRFLDDHTHLPNKVLITSRERAFTGDFSIEVRGMEKDEAFQMLQEVSEDLAISGIVNQDVMDRIFDYTGGHPYVMRILLGEIGKEKHVIPLKPLVSRREDIIDAVFERSFNKLSNDGRWVFLTVGNWRSFFLETALLVILGQRGVRVTKGLRECRCLSLIIEDFLPDEQPIYSAPKLARTFAKKKLQGDPDRLAIQDSLEVLRNFGPVSVSRPATEGQERYIRPFVKWCFSREGTDSDEVNRADVLLERLAELWPYGWLELARFREEFGLSRESIEYALRRAVEEMPSSKEAWLKRAERAEYVGDEATRIASLVSAVDADPRDVDLIRSTAHALCAYVTAHKAEIPERRRGVYLGSVRAHMEQVADKLDATGLSRLAWLFLLERNEEKAWEYANRGCAKDPTNSHCINILQRLEDSGLHG